jgi:hypothetical protein
MKHVVKRSPDRRSDDLNNLFKQTQCLIDMYDGLTNVEVIGVLQLLITSLANSTLKPLPPSDK